MPFFAVASGQAATDERVEAVARHHGVTAAQIRLAWTLRRSPNVLAIPGTGDIGHLDQNIAAGGVKLSEEDLRSIEGLDSASET
ncbi:aldo/keto reductase [Amycolatopsis samaneae]|uniref:Aldo/keto reductase n=1 Tax=Amycolatopsis samaneae TaxID=664691 RepID=A0ABW5GHT6_9PSEU